MRHTILRCTAVFIMGAFCFVLWPDVPPGLCRLLLLLPFLVFFFLLVNSPVIYISIYEAAVFHFFLRAYPAMQARRLGGRRLRPG